MPKIASFNPSTGKPIGSVKAATKQDVMRAVHDAQKALHAWRSIPYSKRAFYLKKAASYFRRHSPRLALLLHKEQGKPLADARGETVKLVHRIENFIRQVEPLLKPEHPKSGLFYNTISREPRGVVAVISPWNFPFSNPLLSICPALLSGNTVIFKPSEVTPLCGAAFGSAFRAAGFPKGVFTTLSGRGDIGAALVDSGINMVSFTGSVGTGKRIMKSSSSSLHALTLELGGKDPMIVLRDADVGKAAEGAVRGSTYNTGQVCSSIERVYVHESIYGEFISLVTEKMLALRMGIDYGPLVREFQLRTVESHVSEALRMGATALCGASRIKGTGFWYAPTVLVGVDHRMKVMRNETFGPVMPIMKFRTEREAVALANDSRYGLSASVWGRNRKNAERIAGMLEAGTVWINEHDAPQDCCPWGGVKESGLGRVRSKEGILEFTVSKVVAVSKSR